MISKKSRIFIAGHNGMVGSAILKKFKLKGYRNIITVNKKKLNLKDQKKVKNFILRIKPELVIIAAAKVGGIFANEKFKGDFIHDNLVIQTNLIESSRAAGVKNLIFLGSSCVYPKFSKQPIKEDYLFSGKLEQTNDAYAVAKLAGYQMCKAYNEQFGTNYITLMPTNIYGPGDNYDSLNSHFFSALLKKIYFAKQRNKKKIEIWGDGKAKRELLFVDDIADACEFFSRKKVKYDLINIGSGIDYSIEYYAKFIMKKLKIKLKIKKNLKYKNGTPRKLLNSNLAKKLGWSSKTNLNDGFQETFKDFQRSISIN
jgi:GDP-L-fucose synthase